MSEYDDTNRGAFFKNDKEGNENRPDYKGPLNVNGVEMEIAGWLKTSKQGKPYMALKVQPKFEAQRPAQSAPQADFPDEIPF